MVWKCGEVSHFNSNKCNSHHMINCFVFSLLKTLSLLFSKPFPPFLSFFKTPGIFLHICKTNVSSRFLFWYWTNLASRLREGSQFSPDKQMRWPNTWGRWGWRPWLINGRELQACLVLDHWQTEPHQRLEAIDGVMKKQVNFISSRGREYGIKRIIRLS